ncbi:hypothetical protein A9Q99_26410 [Gammaproteobacteria bacterium 45_16_T64]|nr:hypothetical protein A9Q99_26410 [Gammaproteobacteria bacterium 45_16_T64]
MYKGVIVAMFIALGSGCGSGSGSNSSEIDHKVIIDSYIGSWLKVECRVPGWSEVLSLAASNIDGDVWIKDKIIISENDIVLEQKAFSDNLCIGDPLGWSSIVGYDLQEREEMITENEYRFVRYKVEVNGPPRFFKFYRAEDGWLYGVDYIVSGILNEEDVVSENYYVNFGESYYRCTAGMYCL